MVFPIVQFGSESWTMEELIERKWMPLKCCRTEKISNEYVSNKMIPCLILEVNIMKMKLKYFKNVMRAKDS